MLILVDLDQAMVTERVWVTGQRRDVCIPDIRGLEVKGEKEGGDTQGLMVYSSLWFCFR